MTDLNNCILDNLYTAVHVFMNQNFCRIANSLCKIFLIPVVSLFITSMLAFIEFHTLLSMTWDRAISAAIVSILYHNHNQNMDP